MGLKKNPKKGATEKIFDKSLKKIGMTTQCYFGGDNMVGNVCNKGYKSLNDGEETLVECLEGEEEKQEYLNSFRSLAKIHKLLFIEKPSDEEIEAAAKECEFFLENFPVWFPNHSITHKMFILGMILPIFIRRERQMLYHFLSAEERGESIHRLLNEF